MFTDVVRVVGLHERTWGERLVQTVGAAARKAHDLNISSGFEVQSSVVGYFNVNDKQWGKVANARWERVPYKGGGAAALKPREAKVVYHIMLYCSNHCRCLNKMKCALTLISCGMLYAASRSNNFVIGLTDVSPWVRAPRLWRYDVCGQWPGAVRLGATVHLKCADN